MILQLRDVLKKNTVHKQQLITINLQQSVMKNQTVSQRICGITTVDIKAGCGTLFDLNNNDLEKEIEETLIFLLNDKQFEK